MTEPTSDPSILPSDLPVPADDGAADHLRGVRLPHVGLESTGGSTVFLDELPRRSVVFAHPRIGRPGREPAGGYDAWNAIPGARGCTPQACSFRDRIDDFDELGVRLFGLSAQDSAYQREALERLRLPYPLLADPQLSLARALALPTFEHGGETLYKRLTLVVRDGEVAEVLYPVFPPDESAAQTLRVLNAAAA